MRKTTKGKSAPRYEYKGCGFPVVILNAPMREILGEWVLDLSPQTIDRFIAQQVAVSDHRLTGKEVTFLRKWAGLSQRALAKKMKVSNVAVHKWEGNGAKASGMDWNTERVLRLFVLDKLEFSAGESIRAVLELDAKVKSSIRFDIRASDIARSAA